MKKILKTIGITLLLITGINALVAGSLFIIDPRGKMMGMSVHYLASSPFHSYLIPGIILVLVNGIPNLWAAFYVAVERKKYFFVLMLQGTLLCGWIVIQVLMVRDLRFLHVLMFAIGCTLFFSGLALARTFTQTNRHEKRKAAGR